MEKIDRLGWAAGISFTAYGRRIGVRANDVEALERARRHLPYGWKPSANPVVHRLYSVYLGGNGSHPGLRRFSLLYDGALRLERTMDVDWLYNVFERSLRLYIAEEARGRLLVHAGVVGWRGKAIVIPGESMSGKSTLVRELVLAGARYYSDEWAAFDSRGRVHPVPRPISIREDGYHPRLKRDYAVGELGGRVGKTPLPVGLILLAPYKPGARWRPQPLSPGLGALQVLAHAFGVRRRPEETLATLQRVVKHASILKGARGEAGEVVKSILSKNGVKNWSAEMPA